jgi:hypothetical protein
MIMMMITIIIIIICIYLIMHDRYLHTILIIIVVHEITEVKNNVKVYYIKTPF